MFSERGNVIVSIACGVAAAGLVVAIGGYVLSGPVGEYGWGMMIAGPWKFALAVTVVGSVIAGMVTTVKVYRRLEATRGNDGA